MVEIMYMYVGLERGLQEIVKYSHCFVNFLLARSYVCPLRELAVPTGQ